MGCGNSNNYHSSFHSKGNRGTYVLGNFLPKESIADQNFEVNVFLSHSLAIKEIYKMTISYKLISMNTIKSISSSAN